MIAPEGRGYLCTCDDCGDAAAIDGADLPGEGRWQAMITELEQLGWRIARQGSGWVHFCPACVEIWRDERRLEEGAD